MAEDKEFRESEELPEEEISEEVCITRREYDELKAREKEAGDIRDRMLRSQAELDNARKRVERDRLEFVKYANEEVIRDLVPMVDDFQRAFAVADKSQDFGVLHKGVEMILNHLLELLKKKGLKPMDALGKPFDPVYHEALMQEENADFPENTVIEELQKGYLLNDRVLRTAKVKVSKQPENISE